MKYKTSKREMYYHIPRRFLDVKGREYNGATVFFREEENGWYHAVAMCSKNDQFNRKLGRGVARRYYFQDKQRFGDLPNIGMQHQPNYETALDLAGVDAFWCDEAEEYCAPTA